MSKEQGQNCERECMLKGEKAVRSERSSGAFSEAFTGRSTLVRRTMCAG